ncbi:MAG: tetratricopeptide repeat protein [Pseudomonadota bacterium]
MIRSSVIALCAAMAGPAWADRDDEPRPTPTTRVCVAGQVWDSARRICAPIQESGLDDAGKLNMAHELAAFGRPEDALRLLAGLARPGSADALTLRGYATRKAGDMAAGLALYDRALALDPDHWQARAYLGAALLESGDRAGAETQLALIRRAGGRGTFPDVALARALKTGGGIYSAVR